MSESLNIFTFWKRILMNTKEDIEKTFLKDLAEYNKIFKKIEKSEELLNAKRC